MYRGGNSLEMTAADIRSSVDKVTGFMKEKGISLNSVPWLNELLWNNEGFFDRWNQGDASGNYNAISGRSSASVLSQMKFGDKFAKNKRAEYGFWSKYNFSPTDRGYKEAAATSSLLAEVSVGGGRKWTPLSGLKQAFPSFETLWNNYPENNIVDGVESPAHPSSNPKYENQCAIRMSECLIKSGFSLKGYPKDDLDEDNKRWALTANRLKYFLSQQIKPTEILTQAKFEEKYWDKTGIIFIVPPKGGIGHIDLFNKGVTGSGYYTGDKIWFWEIE
jgi:Type VI secretion system (T6SS), amidase effector protein 4